MRYFGLSRLFPAILVLVCSALVVTLRATRLAQPHECTVIANNFAYSPSRIDVRQNEIVRIAFRAIDIPHTFTIDAYRIAKRARDGQTVVFEFRADRAGTFPIYCGLTADERFKHMRASLVVAP